MFFYQVFDTGQMFGAIVFAFFSSGELQPWAKSNEEKDSQLRVKMLTVNESN